MTPPSPTDHTFSIIIPSHGDLQESNRPSNSLYVVPETLESLWNPFHPIQSSIHPAENGWIRLALTSAISAVLHFRGTGADSELGYHLVRRPLDKGLKQLNEPQFDPTHIYITYLQCFLHDMLIGSFTMGNGAFNITTLRRRNTHIVYIRIENNDANA